MSPNLEFRRPEKCPECGGPVLRLIWGIPNGEGRRLIDEGTAVSATCFCTPAAPDWQCGKCHHRWSDETDPARIEFLELETRVLAKLKSRRENTSDTSLKR